MDTGTDFALIAHMSCGKDVLGLGNEDLRWGESPDLISR